MKSLARTLALGLVLGLATSAQAAGWKTYFLTSTTIPMPSTADEFRDAMLKAFGQGVPNVEETEFGFNLAMPERIISTGGRFVSVRSFDYKGTPVHVYREELDTSGDTCTAIAIRNRNIEWLWEQFQDANGDGIRDDLLGEGGAQIIEAFRQWIESTKENAAVKEAAKTEFTKKIVDSVFADLDLEHPWLPRAIHVIPGTDLGKTWSITDVGRGRSIAHRAVDLIEKIIHDAQFGTVPEGTRYEFGSDNLYGIPGQ